MGDEPLQGRATESAGGATRPLRIAIVRQRHAGFGGGSRIVERAVEQFTASGREVRFTIVARRWRADDRGRVDFRRCDPPYLGRTMRDATFARAACAATRAGFDLVQAHERIPCADIYRAGDGLHEDWLEALGRGLPGWRRALVRFDPYHVTTVHRERRTFGSPRIRAFIANSDFVAGRIAFRYPEAASRTVVIRNGVDVERFHPSLRDRFRASTLATLGVQEDRRIVAFLGSNWPAKGLRTALDAIAELDGDIHLLVIGKESRPRPFLRRARQLGIGARVHFVGKVDDPRPFLGAADSFVLPSLFDAMPNAVLEAMACGLPVVVSGNSGARDLVREGVEGFVRDPFTGDGWSEAIARTLAAGSRERLGAAARAVALRHTLADMADRWFELYRSLVEGGSAEEPARTGRSASA